jgi:hypothetical protein
VHDDRQLVNAELRTVAEAEAESHPAEVVLLGQRRAKTLRNQCDSGCRLMLFLCRSQRADGRDDWHGSGDRAGGSGRDGRGSSRDDRGSSQRLIEARLEKCEVEVVLKLGNSSRELLDASVLHRHGMVDDGQFRSVMVFGFEGLGGVLKLEGAVGSDADAKIGVGGFELSELGAEHRASRGDNDGSSSRRRRRRGRGRGRGRRGLATDERCSSRLDCVQECLDRDPLRRARDIGSGVGGSGGSPGGRAVLQRGEHGRMSVMKGVWW